jgi:hypothetical protein
MLLFFLYALYEHIDSDHLNRFSETWADCILYVTATTGWLITKSRCFSPATVNIHSTTMLNPTNRNSSSASGKHSGIKSIMWFHVQVSTKIRKNKTRVETAGEILKPTFKTFVTYSAQIFSRTEIHTPFNSRSIEPRNARNRLRIGMYKPNAADTTPISSWNK